MFDEKGELEQVNVLYSFLEDRYMKRVCRYMGDFFHWGAWGGFGVVVNAYFSYSGEEGEGNNTPHTHTQTNKC